MFLDQEQKRLEELKKWGILDTPREREFDEITTMATLVCDAPISLISLLDSTRQWFKSKVGIDIQQTSRNIAFCDYTIRGKNIFIVPDATQDPRFQLNPLVRGSPHIRFYAAVPLICDGHALGTLCVMDMIPRTLNEKQQKILELLANQVCDQIQRKKTDLALENSLKEIIKSEMESLEEILLEDLIDGVLFFLRGKFKKSYVELRLHEKVKSIKVRADKVLLSQVLLQLLNISYYNVWKAEERWISLDAKIEGGFISVVLENSGASMNPGFGLKILHSMLKSHGGHLSYDLMRVHPRYTFHIPLHPAV